MIIKLRHFRLEKDSLMMKIRVNIPLQEKYKKTNQIARRRKLSKNLAKKCQGNLKNP